MKIAMMGLMLSSLMAQSIAMGASSVININTNGDKFIDCLESHRLGLKSCKRAIKIILNNVPLYQYDGATYRGISYLELETNFRATAGDFVVDIDGVKYPIMDDIRLQKFPLPISDKQFLTVTIESTAGNDLESMISEYQAEVLASRLIIDDSLFQSAIAARNNMLNIINAAIAASESVMQYNNAFVVLKSITEKLYDKLSAPILQELSTNANKEKVSILLNNIIIYDKACFFNELDSASQICLTDDEKEVIPLINTAITLFSIPGAWLDASGNSLGFMDFINKLISNSEVKSHAVEHVLEVLSRQSDNDILQKYNDNIKILQENKTKIEQEIIMLQNYETLKL